MHLISSLKYLALFAVLCLPSFAGDEVVLSMVRFKVNKKLDLSFQPTGRAPVANLKGEAEIVKGQTQIELNYRDMKPALLFGGDVTCYVLWAVTQDGKAENLGELWVRGPNGKWEFTSGHTLFGLMLTAEMYVHAERPSPLVVFTATPEELSRATESVTFKDFGDAPSFEQQSISDIAVDDKRPFDLLQAEKTYELATKMGIKESEPALHLRALQALDQARAFATRSLSKSEVKEYARKSIADGNEAIRITLQRREAAELAATIAARKAEMAELEAKARNAETMAKKAERAMLEARVKLDQVEVQRTEAQKAFMETSQKLEALNREKAALEQDKQAMAQQLSTVQKDVSQAQEEMATLRASKQTLETEMTNLNREKAALIASKEKLEKEKAELAGRLQSALSEVAETRDTARGFVVSLPDILFDLNKADLRHEAQLVISKLAGILLMMPELQIRTEGHTDSTGSMAYNQQLCESRAASVKALLISQGVTPDRVSSVGYGETKPIADNDSADGRKANRRVEVVIKDGKIE